MRQLPNREVRLSMVEDTEEEKVFRALYAGELQKMKKITDLEEERKRVNQQSMKTPRRRGEQIKHEEIDRELVRRYGLGNKRD